LGDTTGKGMVTIMNPLKQNLMLFYQATNIPFCIFNNLQENLYRYPIVASMDGSSRSLKYCSLLLKKEKGFHVPLYLSSGTCYCALFRLDSDTNIMFGPVSSVPLTYRDFFHATKDFLTLEDTIHLYRVIQQSPHIKPLQFASALSLFLKLAFGECISAHEIMEKHFDLQNQNSALSAGITQKADYIVGADALALDNRVLFYIQNGLMNKLENFVSDMPLFSIREPFPSTSEELETEFVIYATLCLKTVMDEGLDLKKSLSIFDIYISKIPQLTNVEHFVSLCTQISIDYCTQMVDLQQTRQNSNIVTQCTQFIKTHLDSKITLEDLADHCHSSKRTISRHFAKYHNISASEYILQTKLKEAAFLLTNSAFSLVEISIQLAFSSQSHFSDAFKKKYNYTPQQYRDRFKHD
jgi:AraC-like DNA-binding protein